MQTFIDLNNPVIDRFTAQERENIGIHTCPGGDNDAGRPECELSHGQNGVTGACGVRKVAFAVGPAG